MSHAIMTEVYEPLKGGKPPVADMIMGAEEFANETVDPYEDPSRSYHGDFRELSGKVFSSRREAEKFLEGFNGSYRDGYVRFHEDKETAALKKARERYKNLCAEKSAFEASSAQDVLNRKSAYIGCSNCGSKISRIYLHRAVCPVCGNDLRCESVFKRLMRYDERIEAAKAAVEKAEGGGKLMYLAKYEVHC